MRLSSSPAPGGKHTTWTWPVSSSQTGTERALDFTKSIRGIPRASVGATRKSLSFFSKTWSWLKPVQSPLKHEAEESLPETGGSVKKSQEMERNSIMVTLFELLHRATSDTRLRPGLFYYDEASLCWSSTTLNQTRPNSYNDGIELL